MKPIIKSLQLASGTIKKYNKTDYITHSLSKDTINHNDTIEPPYNPESLKQLRYSSIYHRKCLKAKAVDVTMTGWLVRKTNTEKEDKADGPNKAILENLFKDYTFETSFFKALEDYGTYGYGIVELLRNSLGDIVKWNYIRSNTARMCKDGERVRQQVGASTVYFKVAGKRPDEDLDYRNGTWMTQESLDEYKATEVLWIGDSSPDSEYYGEPDYLSALLTILSDEYLREYNNNSFITNGIPNYFITITGNFDTEEDDDGNTFEEALESQILDLQNKPGTAVVFTIPTTDPDSKIDVQVTRISDEQKEASFEQFRESNMNEILAAHEIPPSRLGIVYNGPLGGSVDEERNKLYAEKTIRPLQRKVEQLINTIIIEGLMDIHDYKFKYQNLNTRNVLSELEVVEKLFKMAAIKPGEIRDRFSDVFNLVMDVDEIPIIDYNPELDEFYMNGQPLTMSDGSPPTEDVEAIVKSIDQGIQSLITT